MKNAGSMIEQGLTALGIELGSTRIKAVLTGEDCLPLASGSYDWENRFENGVWTYSLDDAWAGIRAVLRELAGSVKTKYGVELRATGSIGISGMMHGYLVFDSEGRQLVPFRTWRNTITAQAAEILSDQFCFCIPQRWSVAHLYQAVLNREPHVAEIAFITTLSGYIHWRLSGERVLGIGDASGMFPIDSEKLDYNAEMLAAFDKLAAGNGFTQRLSALLPRTLNAGEHAGALTEEGARLLSPDGILKPGIPMCPPEGDAGTGMVATNSIRPKTGSVSTGTSAFVMIVMESELSKVYRQINIVTTPSGNPVALVQCNNCTGDLDAWVKLFGEFGAMTGAEISKPAIYDMLYSAAMQGNVEQSGLLMYNYYSGEHLTGIEQGRPLLVRTSDSRFTVPNLMRTILFSSIATLKIGLDILTRSENVALEKMMGHGGLFKTKDIGQIFMASALNVPVAVMESAGEGGAWGIALLAAYMARKHDGQTLADFLEQNAFANMQSSSVNPDASIARDFDMYMRRYRDGLDIERAAVEHLIMEQ